MKEKIGKIFKNKIVIALGVLILIGALFLVYFLQEKHIDEPAIMMTTSAQLEFAGSLEANETKPIYSVVNQVKAVDVKVNEGDFVKEGDVLVELDKTAITYDIKAKELELEQAKIDYDTKVSNAESELSNLNKAINSGLSSEIVEREAALHTAQADYDNLVYKWNKSVQNYANGLDQSLITAQNSLHSAQVAYCKSEKDGKANIKYYEETVETKRQAYEEVKKQVEAGTVSADSIKEVERAYTEAKAQLDDVKTKAGTDLDAQATAVNNATATLTAVDSSIQVQNNEYYVLDFIKASATLADAEASLAAAKLAQQTKKDTLERTVENATASTTVSQCQVALDRLNADSVNYTIKAPCNGYISGLDVKVGDTVGQKVLMNVLNYDTMKVVIDVNEYDIDRFTMDTPVKVKINSIDKVYDGKVTGIAAKAEKKNDLSFIKITASFQPDEQLSAGIGATVYTIQEENNEQLCVPAAAVKFNTETGESEVTVVEEGNKTHQQTVVPGSEIDGYIVITQGLKEGDIVRYSQKDAKAVSDTEDSSEQSGAE